MEDRVKKLISEFRTLDEEINRRRNELHKIFVTLIDKEYAQNGETAAFSLAREIPCCVIRALINDRIRYFLPNKKIDVS